MKHKEKKKHLERPSNIQQDAPQPQSFMEVPGYPQAAGENTSTSEYFPCVSSSYHLPHQDKYGTYNIQQDAPQPESFMEAPGCSKAVGENASASKYFNYVSSPPKRPHYDEDGSHQLQQNVPYLGESNMPVSQSAWKWKTMEWTIGGIKETPVPKDLVQTKTFSANSYTSNSSASNKDPRLMKIYYMHVQMKRGVAVMCHTEDGWKPPSQRIKMEEMTYTTEVHRNVPLSHTSGENLLNDPEPSVDSPAQEKREKAGCPAAPSTLVFCRRVPLRRPLDSGFRCLACCHIFASLEALQQHVEHGIQEGFSCHVFHRAMARLEYKKLTRKKKN